jgi:hypothetical protein
MITKLISLPAQLFRGNLLSIDARQAISARVQDDY